MAAAFAEALKRPDVVRDQFDLLYASLLGEGEEEEEDGSGSSRDEEGGWVGSEGEAASPGALSALSMWAAVAMTNPDFD